LVEEKDRVKLKMGFSY